MRTRVVLALALIASASPVDGQVPVSRSTLEVTRVSVPPVIDGNLDDPAWQNTPQITDFLQMELVDGAPATEQTEVWIAYDSRYLYLAFYAHYSDPLLIRANRSDRDKIARDDRISVYLDTFLDQQLAFMFAVNGYGVQADAIRTASTGTASIGTRSSSGTERRRGSGGSRASTSSAEEDLSWDALFDTSGSLVEDGWVAEMAIPFKSLRYPGTGDTQSHRWGPGAPIDRQQRRGGRLVAGVARRSGVPHPNGFDRRPARPVHH